MAVPQREEHKHNPGRDEGMIVKTYKFGETTVHISDSHIAKTQEERDRVDAEIATAAWACIQDAIEEGEAD